MYITFDYHCPACTETTERFVKKTDQDAQKCDCGTPLKRLVAGTRTHFRFADSKLKK